MGTHDKEISDAIDKENSLLAQRIKSILISALGTNGLLLRDNEVEFLIDVLDDYIENME